MRWMSAMLVGVATLFTLGVWLICQNGQDAIHTIDRSSGKVTLLHDSVLSDADFPPNRIYRRIVLSTAHLGEIEAVISQPEKITEKIPLLLVMGGWEVGAKNFRLVRNPGEYLLVIYRYPYQPVDWKEGMALREIFRIRKAIYSVPAQVLTLVDWFREQPYVDKRRISLLGFSLGALFLPSVYHLDAVRGDRLNAGVIAFGGADLKDILQTNLKNINTFFRAPAASAAACLIRDLEPALHLPYMQNRFLIINASRDEMISPHSRELLIRLTPEPKTVVTLETGHIGTNKIELVQKVVEISTRWLIENGVLDADD